MTDSNHTKKHKMIAAIMSLSLIITSVLTASDNVSALEQKIPGSISIWPGGIGNTLGDTDTVNSSNYTAVKITAEEYPDKAEMQFTDLYTMGALDYIQVLQQGSLLKVIEIPGSNGSNPGDFELTLRLVLETDGIDITLEKNNYYLPVKQTLKASDGRTCDIFIIAVPEDRSFIQEKVTDDYLKAGNALLKRYQEMASVYWDMKDNHDYPAFVGSPHPAARRCLTALNYGLQPYIIPRNAGVFPPGSNTTPETAAGWLLQAGYFTPEQAEAIFDTVYTYFIQYAQKPVESPVLLGLTVANSIAERQNDGTFTVMLPAGLNMSKIKESAVYQVADPAAVIVSSTGAWKLNGISAVTITAKDPATIHIYNSETQGMISSSCLLRFTEGEPDFGLSSFSAAGRVAVIDQDLMAVSIHLPEGISKIIAPEAVITGSSVSYLDENKTILPVNEDGVVDLAAAEYLVVNNDYSQYMADPDAEAPIFTKEYKLIVTQGNSSECSLLAFSSGIADEYVVWNDCNISITIPYTSDWNDINISYTASYDAAVMLLSGDDYVASVNMPVVYRVIAQNGQNYKDYSIRINKLAPSADNTIDSFKYGSLSAVIDNVGNTVRLELPAGSEKVFAPSIELPAFASVEPESGVLQDFEDPVVYTVTAQDGSKRVYTVNVTVSDIAKENPRKDELWNRLNSIISRYRISAEDDWEWLDLGIYENKLQNDMNGFDLAKEIRDLNVGLDATTTDIDRLIMMLTAMGYDCTKLASYNDGKPFTDAAGNSIDDLVANLYNTNKKLTSPFVVNGVAFALIALDMGNYTIPENAKVTRQSLLEYLIGHEYLSDGWGVDMVGMLMYAIAPYQDDPIYGERVKAKLDEGVSLFAQKMKYDYSFESFDAINSEAASQVIAALSSCGIDCYSDPRFSGENGSVLDCWLKKFAVSGGFKHIESGGSDVLATYEACYALQWYLGFLDRGGAGNPYYLYYNRFDFSSSLSGDANIVSFVVDGCTGTITEGSGSDRSTISVSVPKDMPLSGLTPQLGLSAGASLLAPALPISFVAGIEQPFSIIAQDGVTVKTYYVTLTPSDIEPSGSSLDIASIVLEDSNMRQIEILNKTVTESEDSTDILITVGSSVNTEALRLYAGISYGASVSAAVDGSKTSDLSDWAVYTVTSGDGARITNYRIKVQNRIRATIESFTVNINGLGYSAVIDHSAGTIIITGVDDSVLESTVFLPEIILGNGASVCSPLSGIAQDFSAPVIYTAAGTDIESRSYTVSITNISGQLIRVSSSSSYDTGTIQKTDPQVSTRLWEGIAEKNTIIDHQVSYGHGKLRDQER